MQKPPQYRKAIIFQLKINKFKKKKLPNGLRSTFQSFIIRKANLLKTRSDVWRFPVAGEIITCF